MKQEVEGCNGDADNPDPLMDDQPGELQEKGGQETDEQE